jgi:hypothetical protein
MRGMQCAACNARRAMRGVQRKKDGDLLISLKT